jgi:hypothetical protein
LTEGIALLSEGQGLIHGGAGTEVLTDFIKGRAEASGTGEGAEAAHRIVALFDAAVILLKSIVQVLVGTVEDLATKRAADRSVVTRAGLYPTVAVACLKNALAAVKSRVTLSIVSTRLPSRSMARYR